MQCLNRVTLLAILLTIYGSGTASSFSSINPSSRSVPPAARSNDPECVDCVIIGGGPAGLSAAIAVSAASPSSSVRIYERDNFAPKGASIQISSSGWRSLGELDDSAGLTNSLKRTGVPVTKIEVVPWRDDAASVRPFSLKAALLRFVFRAAAFFFRVVLRRPISNIHLWHDVRTVLAEHAEKVYGEGTGRSHVPLLSPNSSLANIRALVGEEHDSSIPPNARFELTMEDADTGARRKVYAACVLACDGVRSRTRSLLPHEPDVLLAEGKSVWRGVSPNVSVGGAGTFYRGVAENCSALHFPGGKGGGSSWSIIGPAADGKSQSDGEARARVLGVVESMGTAGANYGLFRDVIGDSPIVIENKLHVRDFDLPWESAYDGLAYTGDAAHPVRPTGEGTALAFEDAVVLGRAVASYGLGVEALRAYERERYEPVRLISEKIRRAADAFYRNKGDTVGYDAK
mmetsp:Transcript_42425/g.83352  ORF Transcript_42425/g.83352 Transcript_42425/m.83352 type:complete len:459 (+) Transcript_42425:79-1455(+)|eukprot:CAMPEP_0194327580 /NCGR_PEP_ID=MMETSP0171-20130528/41707_1 /TAXON_ID=218684 /ORGANISM="Corethron pennatum, Strain L29A3" /LENGTH=458 /DNA_ID=CAMNT_0039087583 /DNA_START=66 /DNA_END=1442 /DNA_ORIENTATION=-